MISNPQTDGGEAVLSANLGFLARSTLTTYASSGVTYFDMFSTSTISPSRSEARTSLDGRLGAVGRGVGFVEIFIGNFVRLGGSTQLGQPGQDGDRFVGRR